MDVELSGKNVTDSLKCNIENVGAALVAAHDNEDLYFLGRPQGRPLHSKQYITSYPRNL